MKPEKKYNKFNQLVYSITLNNVEKWWEYHSNGKKKSYKDSEGNIRLYDINGNEIYHKAPDGFEKHWKYNNNNQVIHYFNSKNFQKWWIYNNKGLNILYKDSKGYQITFQYDKMGKKIYSIDSNGFEKYY